MSAFIRILRFAPTRRRLDLSRFGITLIALAVLLLTGAAPLLAFWDEETEGKFNAFWNLSGTVHVLQFIDSTTATAGSLEGKLLFQTNTGQIPAFDTECVVFEDDRTGGLARCVWTDPTQDQIFCDISSRGQAGSGSAQGKFVGGTGRYQGITGEFSFVWNYNVSGGEDATLDGQTLRMTGQYRLSDQ